MHIIDILFAQLPLCLPVRYFGIFHSYFMVLLTEPTHAALSGTRKYRPTKQLSATTTIDGCKRHCPWFNGFNCNGNYASQDIACVFSSYF